MPRQNRSPVAKDRDRIIHCGAFRRLQRKGQIVGVQSSDFFRTWLTHTIECAQVARGIARRSMETPDLDTVVEDPDHLSGLLEAAAWHTTLVIRRSGTTARRPSAT